MAPPTEDLSPPPQPVDRGSLFGGIAMSIGIQILILIVTGAISFAIEPTLELLPAFWGYTQWLLVVPLLLKLRKAGKDRTFLGLIIMSFIGVLVSTACAAIISDISKHGFH